MGLVSDLRQPEYVGDNRCPPCTVVNVAIAFVLGFGCAALLTPLAGFVVIACSLVAIYLRGYLVPGTPELTKRYLPARVLRWFGKQTGSRSAVEPPGASTPRTFDPERLLADGGVIGPCAEIDDLCLAPAFRRAWHDRIDAQRAPNSGPDALEDAVGADTDDDLRFERVTGDDVLAIADSAAVGRWISEAAITADVAASDVLPEYVPWARLDATERIELLATCRFLMETCPVCGEPVELTDESIESCCQGSYDVVRTTCLGCGAHLNEFDWN